MAGLTPNVANLRATLLQRLGFSLDFEKQQITSAKEALSSLLSDNDAPATRNLEAATAQFSQLTGAVKLAVGQWLCEEVCRLASYDINLTGNGDVCFALPEPLFCRTRSVLEQLEDHASLSVLLSKATTSTDASVLTSIVDTVNMHAQTLAAIGALPELTSHLCKRQRLLRVQQPLDKVFLGALSSLMQRVPTDPALVRALNSDVALCEQQISAAACSPASDSMIAQQPGTLEADEDISRVLSSGNSMDDHLMQRMFSVITQRAAKAGSNNVGNTARWYSQLRTFDQSAFDQLAQDLMRKLATGGADSGTVTAVSCALVGMGSMQLDVLHGAFSRQIETIGSSDPMKASRLAATSLQVLVPSSNSAGVLQSAVCSVLFLPQVHR
ncbi:RNA polymerase II mediator complex subunit [Taxawa tesnikishii (nom. ined.)]|nr:RNA polymerase II mediator complex subunit [Dothideales sp. JES 119]